MIHNPDLPKAWLQPFAKFIKDYGHRCENEWDIQAPSWRLNPTPLLTLIGAYMRLEEDASPFADLEMTAHRREELTQRLLEKIPVYKRFLFKLVLSLAQKKMANREYTKSYGVRAVRLIEFPLQEIKKRFTQRELIDSPEDIFFLSQHDIESILRGQPVSNLRETIHQKKEGLSEKPLYSAPGHLPGLSSTPAASSKWRRTNFARVFDECRNSDRPSTSDYSPF